MSETPQFKPREKIGGDPVTFLMHMPDMGDIYFAPRERFEAVYYIVYGNYDRDFVWGQMGLLKRSDFSRGTIMSRLIVYHHIKEKIGA